MRSKHGSLAMHSFVHLVERRNTGLDPVMNTCSDPNHDHLVVWF